MVYGNGHAGLPEAIIEIASSTIRASDGSAYGCQLRGSKVAFCGTVILTSKPVRFG